MDHSIFSLYGMGAEKAGQPVTFKKGPGRRQVACLYYIYFMDNGLFCQAAVIYLFPVLMLINSKNMLKEL